MADSSKVSFWDKILGTLKDKSGELSKQIDLSGIKLPGAKADVELGEGTKKLIYGALALLGFFIVGKIFRLF